MKTYLKPIFFIFIALLLMLTSIAFSATAVLYFRPLYYGMINKFVGKNGLSFIQIKENYDALINYNSFWGPEKLNFPYLHSSENALTHFEEVKAIFLEFQIVLITGLIVLAILIFLYKKIYATCEYLLLGGLITMIIPLTLAVFIYANFNKVFVAFHKLAFNNDYWIFNYKTDPIITFLPENFFMLCAIAIVGLVFLLGIIMLFMFYKKSKKH